MNKDIPKKDKIFLYFLLPWGGIIICILLFLIVILANYSIPILLKEGINFFIKSDWNAIEGAPEKEFYGILSPFIGTLIVSLIAIIIALPLSISLTIFIEHIAPDRIRGMLVNTMEVMAGLPTVLYGLWGVTILAPFLKTYVMDNVYSILFFIPLFSCRPISPYTLFTAGIVLAIMIIPFVSSIIRESYELVPMKYKEAILGIGASRYEYSKIMFSLLKPAIIGALLLGLGRAMGETVAVAMTIGNSFNNGICIFSPGYTISSLIANQFGNAGFYKYMTSALYAGGLLLLLLGVFLNSIATYIIIKWRRML